MEDALEWSFKGIARVLAIAVRILVWFILELCVETVGWYVGWCVLRLLTFNCLPKEGINDYDRASFLLASVVCTAGLVFLVGVGTLLALYLGVPVP